MVDSRFKKALVAFGGAALLTAAALPAAAQDSPWQGRTILVTGANRGLGLELARQLQAAGATVLGTARSPGAQPRLTPRAWARPKS